MELEAEMAQVGDRDWRNLYKHLRERHAAHVRSAVRRTTRYKKMATTLHILIPTMSLALTILAGSDFTYQHTVTAGAAIALTIATGTNYTLEPAERYRAYAEICIQLHDWMFKMEGEVEKLGADCTPDVMIDYLEKMNSSFSEIGRSMANLPVPRARVG